MNNNSASCAGNGEVLVSRPDRISARAIEETEVRIQNAQRRRRGIFVVLGFEIDSSSVGAAWAEICRSYGAGDFWWRTVLQKYRAAGAGENGRVNLLVRQRRPVRLGTSLQMTMTWPFLVIWQRIKSVQQEPNDARFHSTSSH